MPKSKPIPRSFARIFTQTARQIPLGLFAAMLALACQDPVPTAGEPKIQLVDRLAFAKIRALDQAGTTASAMREDSAFIQMPDTVIRFGFSVPPAGKFVATPRLSAPASGPGETVLRISLRDARDQESILYEQSIVGSKGSEPETIALDLSRWSSQLVNLDLHFLSPASEPRLRWEGTRIDGALAPEFEPKSLERAKYNVLIILLDSLRADHLTPYGSRDIATPRLAVFADKGVVFETARSNASWTRPSVATMFTSRHPWGHGVNKLDAVLSDSIPYLPELLSDAGYKTEGVTESDMISSIFGMSRGFDTLYRLQGVDAYNDLRSPQHRARYVWTHLLDELTSQEKPFFAYLHLLDPHSPYEPAAKYRRRFVPKMPDHSVVTSALHIGHMRKRANNLSEEQIDHLGRMYKGEVAFMDDYVGELIRLLEVRGLTKNTLLIFTSDHGEEFFDHQSVGHGHSVYEELLSIPLILRLDGVLPARVRVNQPVDLIDLSPTVLDLLGLDIPSTMRGQSMLRYIEYPAAAAKTVSLASSARPRLHTIRHGKWKLIRHSKSRRGPEEAVELFDLELDPKELNDLASQRPVVTEALRQLLAWHLERGKLAGAAPEEPARLDERTYESLKAIGYLAD